MYGARITLTVVRCVRCVEKAKETPTRKQRRRRMTREAFIKKWLGNRDYNYCEEHKKLMRDDLDSVLDFHNAKKKTCGFCVEPSEKAKQKEALIELTQMGDYETKEELTRNKDVE